MTQTLTDIYEHEISSGALSRDPAQEAAVAELDAFRARVEARPDAPSGLRGFFKRGGPEPVKGLYLWGGVGRGKSMLMDLFAANSPGGRTRRVHFHAFMQEVHDGMDRARKTGVDDAVKPVAEEIAEKLDVLCLDEMQISDIADAMIVGRLFERLFAGGVAIVTTSNREPAELYKNGLNRQLFVPFIELIEERMEVHHLASPTDYRQDRLSGGDVYFSPDTREARAEVEAIWQDLSKGESEPLVLRVKGREVRVEDYARGVVKSSFYDLCGRPLGPADYLALADAIRVLVLIGVPRLSRSNFNEAKRFVTLIDALYEARVRLVCTAADTPESLYVEGEGSFEFERTASRLREMQAEGWGGE
ncbi:cell division protein ZapE [Roseicyclus sp. F158]|uniref:Cell division protein ZapE n=1 Tax=Tropicimonas omnivorans TaxID=3075590 RepID=A0ABU3DBJ0_9RHOB|nr:cell division protein ZapE [Roseicyclus sp. F158]MDT0681082.1 cell division protein ZapE [Roseicyclus sp. F158]